ncbi:MAG: Lpg1974 family pore-forming outer membrane protein [Verrucomicrobia bacterium]|nr:Lpg1974 family pore-forming outer membrane protein [Verrucomicrobiota bacterium]
MKPILLIPFVMALPVFAGTPAPVTAPPQAPSEQGWTLGLEIMALQPYQSEGAYDDTDFDVAWRGSLGYQFSDGLFLKGTYFGYKTETDSDEDLKMQYVDLVIGQNFKPMEKLSISPFIGVRWASFEEEYGGVDFDGWGIVLGVDATRALGNNISLYVTAKQSVVFGNDDGTSGDNATVAISEVGAGLQYDFCFGSVAGNVRGGVEGQYWSGLSDDDSEDMSLFGFVLGVNFRF